MVLKIIQMNTIEAARWVTAAIILSAFIWSVGGFIALALWNTYRNDIIETAGLASSEDIGELKAALQEAAVSFTALSRQIVILSRPDQITLYREPPSPVAGFCAAGEDCVISVFAERSQRALDCRILGPRTELLILSHGREYVGAMVSQKPASNLQSSPRALEPAFRLPLGIPVGPATAIIRSYYTDCAWQIDGQPPAIQDSPSFPLEIVPSQHNRPQP